MLKVDEKTVDAHERGRDYLTPPEIEVLLKAAKDSRYPERVPSADPDAVPAWVPGNGIVPAPAFAPGLGDLPDLGGEDQRGAEHRAAHRGGGVTAFKALPADPEGCVALVVCFGTARAFDPSCRDLYRQPIGRGGRLGARDPAHAAA